MKQLFVLIVLLCVGGLAWSDDAFTPKTPALTWGGYISTGVTVLSNGVDQPVVGLWDDQQWYPNGKAGVTGDWNAGPYGFKFDLQYQGPAFVATTDYNVGTTSGVHLKTAYGYISFLNNLVDAQFGIVDYQKNRPDSTATLRPCFAYNGVAGTVVEVAPVDGLSFNAGIVGINPTTSVTSPTVMALTTVPAIAGTKYTVPGLGSVMGEIEYAQTNPNATTSYNLAMAYVAANLTTVPNLTVWFEGLLQGYGGGLLQQYYSGTATSVATQIQGYYTQYGLGSIDYTALNLPTNKNNPSYLNDGRNDGVATLVETVSYGFKDWGVEPLHAGLVAAQYVYGSDFKTNQAVTYFGGTLPTSVSSGDTVNPSLRFSPWVAYALAGGAVVPTFIFTYFSGPEILNGSLTQTNCNYNDNYLMVDAPLDSKGGKLGFSPVAGGNGANLNKVAMVEIKPLVTLHYSADQSLTFAYAFQASVGSEDVYFSNGNYNSTFTSNSSSKVNQVFQVSYAAKF